MAADGSIVINIYADSGEAEKEINSFRKTAGAAIKGIGAAVAAGASAAAALGKSAIQEFADYEQLVGGVETLFKDNASAVEEYAAAAYKTAGLTANAYMETVTSFSASLLQSLDGDTKAAADAANTAVVDMADNANKMGTSMESIQNAYQGFAKQNYTMLDNLKLGYGGTKEEMLRLLEDAEKLSGVKYDISSLDDVYSAIHVVQTELGITGTTAEEAASTIQGSLASMKGAWGNLLVGIADDTQSIDLLIADFVDSVGAVADNLLPRVEIVFEGMAGLAEKLLPKIVEQLPTLANSVLPRLTELGASLIQTIIQGIADSSEMVADVATDILTTLINAIILVLPSLVTATTEILAQITNGISEALPTLIPAAVQAIRTIAEGLIGNVPVIVDAALQLVTGLTNGIIAALPVIVAALPTLITGLVTTLLESIPLIIEAGVQLLTSLVAALPDIITVIVEALPQIIDGIITALLDSLPVIVQAGIDLLVALIQALPEIIAVIVEAIPQIVSSVVGAFADHIGDIIEAGVQLFVALIQNLPDIIVEIVKAIPQIITSIVEGFADAAETMATIGLDLIKGIWNGISDAAAWLWKKVSGWCDDLLGKIKGFFGIHSPSTVFAGLGEYMVEGLGNGIEDNADIAVDAVEDLSKAVKDAWDGELDSKLVAAIDADADDYCRRMQEAVNEMHVSTSDDVSQRVNGVSPPSAATTNNYNHTSVFNSPKAMSWRDMRLYQESQRQQLELLGV